VRMSPHASDVLQTVFLNAVWLQVLGFVEPRKTYVYVLITC